MGKPKYPAVKVVARLLRHHKRHRHLPEIKSGSQQ